MRRNQEIKGKFWDEKWEGRMDGRGTEEVEEEVSSKTPPWLSWGDHSPSP